VRRVWVSVVLGGSLAWGVPIAVASCSDPRPVAPLADPPEASAAGDVNPPRPPLPEGSTVDANGPAQCSVPADIKTRCSGTDPRVVFYPPIACDPRSLDASTTSDGGPCSGVSTSDVSFTADACRAFADAELGGRVSYERTTRAPSFTEPSDGAALTPDEWSIFAWSKGPSARFKRLLDWIEPSAFALTPLKGDGYVLEFSQGCTEVLRVMLATTYWSPDPASWNLLTNTQGPVTVRVYWASFKDDAIATGPVVSAPVQITMTH
jgi:hypothetical protein